MKKLIITIIIILVVVLGWYYLSNNSSQTPTPLPPTGGSTTPPPPTSTTPPPAMTHENGSTSSIGKSVEARDIAAYYYGTGDKKIVFVAGLHGGYEWHTTLVAYQLMDYLKKTPTAIPAGVQVTVIPTLNPDGLNKVVPADKPFTAANVKASQAVQVSGRYNANKVDLNRNFDCDWQATGKWQGTTVSGGSAAFSEPESQAMKNFITSEKPAAVVAFYSAAGGVFSAGCTNGISSDTKTLTDLYSKASGYPAYQSFDFYSITGDMSNWITTQNIPAINILLTDHTSTEWTKNKAGIDAILQHYGK